MKRITFWALSTLTVLVLLLGYRTSLAGPDRNQDVVAASPATNSTPSTSSGTTTSGSGSGDGSGSGSSTDSNPSTGSTSSSSTATSRTITGASVDTRWGPVQVEITVADGKITAVNVVEYPTENHKDVEINNYAIPALVQETMDAQSANIDMISGATVTSEGYISSLQSALDEAGL